MYSWICKCILGPMTRDSPFKIREQVGLKPAYSVHQLTRQNRTELYYEIHSQTTRRWCTRKANMSKVVTWQHIYDITIVGHVLV